MSLCTLHKDSPAKAKRAGRRISRFVTLVTDAFGHTPDRQPFAGVKSVTASRRCTSPGSKLIPGRS